MKSLRNKTVFWIVLLYITRILLMPMDNSEPLFYFPHIDKVVHAGIFFTLTYLLIHAYTMTRPQYFIVFLAYGIITEYLQSLTGYRSGDLYDLFADMAGVILLFSVVRFLPKKLQPDGY